MTSVRGQSLQTSVEQLHKKQNFDINSRGIILKEQHLNVRLYLEDVLKMMNKLARIFQLDGINIKHMYWLSLELNIS